MDDIWAAEPDLEELRRLHALLKINSPEALDGLKQLAERGSVMSMVYIAKTYAEGAGAETGEHQAERWYRRAAEAGSMLASYELGRLCLERNDYIAAKAAFDAGLSHNYPPAIHMLALMYLRGNGVPADRAKAKALLEKSASLGHVFSKRNLGVLLMSGNFGSIQRLRGVGLFLSALKDAASIVRRDPMSDRLR